MSSYEVQKHINHLINSKKLSFWQDHSFPDSPGIPYILCSQIIVSCSQNYTINPHMEPDQARILKFNFFNT